VRSLSSHSAEPARVPLSSQARRAVSVPSSRSQRQRLWRVLTGLSLVIVLVAVLVSAVLTIIGLIS
jgi:disulfide bond formation protein DsbB